MSDERKRSKSTHVAGHVYVRNDGTKGIKLWTPEKVIPCHDADELKLLLKHYSRDILSTHTPKSTHARRKYVEKIRPALRFYCQKFGVKVPQWLQDDKRYTEIMTAGERQAHFGKGRLNIREFKELKPIGSRQEDGGKSGSPR